MKNIRSLLTQTFFTTITLLLIAFNPNLNAQCTGVSESDSLELVALYEALDGDNWTTNTGWLVDPVSEWYGIGLTEDSCHVKKIALYSNHFSGELFDINLPYLYHIHLTRAGITQTSKIGGALPNFSNLPNLTDLAISHQNLSGEIPNFEFLPNLIDLILWHNNFSGELPDFEFMPNLDILWLSDNQLSGETPNFKLPNVTNIKLNDNQLSGKIPNFEFLENINQLNLQYNYLSGEIPNFEFMPSLEYLYLRGNQLTGTVPDFDYFPELEVLDLMSNNLSGEIPNFSSLDSLRNLHLNINELTGEIPNFNLPNLTLLYLNNNQLTGEIPNFNNLDSLITLYLSNNQLTGEIPNFDQVLNLKKLVLKNNQLSGNLPYFENLINLERIEVGSNQLSNYIPNFNLPLLTYLQVCPNDFIGPLPTFNNCPFINDVSDSCLNPAYISGYVYHDENENCDKEEEEIGVPYAKIIVDDSLRIAYTDSSGYYRLGVDTGAHVISYLPSIDYWEQTCPADFETYTVYLENFGDEASDINFGNEILTECPALNIMIGTPLLRRCFQNTYTLEYCNLGTFQAENAYLEVSFPEQIIPLSSDLEYEETDGLLSFELGDIAIGECRTFSIIDSVSCDAILGSGACVSATIFPNETCQELIPPWDGADLSVEGTCTMDSILFILSNKGENMSISTEYRIYEDDILSAIEIIQLEEDEELELLFPINGTTYKVEVDQTPNHPLYEMVSATIENCDDEVFLLGTLTNTPEGDESLAYEVDCQEIIGSFDPNDKLAVPAGIGEEHYISAEDQLTYKIRFQNVGNDTAFNVIVVDTIDNNYLDITSVEMAGSSHDYNLRIVGNVLEWTFEDILLVDSTTNETESHGFIQFKINQQENNTIGSIINNQAAIYFDYNEPIYTPMAFHEVWEEPIPTNNNNIAISLESQVNIYPNPMSDYCVIELPVWSLEKIRITNINGREVLSQAIQSESDLKINTAKFASGLYYFHLFTKDGYTVQKLIKH